MNRILQHTMAVAATLAVVSCSKAETPAVSDTARPADSSAMMPAAAAATAAAPAPTGKVNPTTASQAEIAAAGVADSIAGAIVATRPANMLALDKVLAKTYSKSRRDSIYAHLWIPLDLNKATREEILVVPGVGAKMAHEFEEYRPWTSIEQFRREIGKYVDKTEVARLEQYVAIKP
jgi:DNA uptake protein ComE-like DNA-binding protein